MKIKDLMIPDPITITKKATIQKAIAVMKTNSIRHLPVVTRGKRLVGLVTLADLKQGLIPSMVAGVTLADLMVKDILRPPDWAVAWYVRIFGSLMGYSLEEKRIYHESLRAAFSVAEMATQVSQAGFLNGATVRRVSFTNYIIQYTKPMAG